MKDRIRIGPALRTIPLPLVEPKLSLNLSHSDDELGLYTFAAGF
jgi:hypothetical protein